ncbi:MAG: BON domain-containing protein [Desulfotignum sp.]|nr:BON domain-containing protein [Desulfotignum sp.]
MAGVKAVDITGLDVAPLPVTINDVELEENIKDSLERDTFIGEYDIVVNVRSGVAELYGKMNTYFEKMRAEDLAASIAGIYFVDNNIGVNRDWSRYHYRPYMDLDNFFSAAPEKELTVFICSDSHFS